MKKNEENNEEAIHYIKMAADKGCTKAMFNYYTIISKSNEDDEEVDLYLRKAAFKGHTKAMYEYASILLKNNDNRSFLDSLQFLKNASDKGNINAIYLYCTAPISKNILNYENNMKFKYESSQNKYEIDWHQKKSAKYLKIAANLGYLEAIKIYANKLYNGIDVEKNIEEAVMYYKIGSEKDDADCIYN